MRVAPGLALMVLTACAAEPAPDSGMDGARADTGAARVDSGIDSSAEPPGDSGVDGSGPDGTAPDGTAPDASAALGPDCVAELYETSPTGASPWYLGEGDFRDRIRQFGTITGSDRLTTVRASGQVRFTVIAEAGSTCEGDMDHGRALSRGFMCTENDWRNFEMTGYLHLLVPAPLESEQDFTMYGNGGRHTGGGAPVGCLGSSYKASYDYVQGRARFAKESWHVLYAWSPWHDVPSGPDLTAEDRFVGFKYVRYEFERDGARGVRLELWMDLGPQDALGCPANEWTLVDVREDHPGAGSWGSDATDCMAPVDDQIMFWGGPWVTWRWDETEAELRLMNVREIVPPAAPPPP